MKLEEQVKLIIEDELHVKIRHEGELLLHMGADVIDLLTLSERFEDELGVNIDLGLIYSVRDVIRLVKEAKEN